MDLKAMTMRTLACCVLIAVATHVSTSKSFAQTPAETASMQHVAANKDAVIAFYNRALNDKDPEAALQYLGER